MNDTVTTLRNTARWFEAHGRNCNSAVVDICNDAAAQLESQQAQLAEEVSRRYQAECNYDHAVEDRDRLRAQLAEAQRERDEAVKRTEYLSGMAGQGFNW